MPARQGGSYYMRAGKPVLKERTGHKPESRKSKPAAKPAQTASDADNVKEEQSNADA